MFYLWALQHQVSVRRSTDPDAVSRPGLQRQTGNIKCIFSCIHRSHPQMFCRSICYSTYEVSVILQRTISGQLQDRVRGQRVVMRNHHLLLFVLIWINWLKWLSSCQLCQRIIWLCIFQIIFEMWLPKPMTVIIVDEPRPLVST